MKLFEFINWSQLEGKENKKSNSRKLKLIPLNFRHVSLRFDLLEERKASSPFSFDCTPCRWSNGQGTSLGTFRIKLADKETFQKNLSVTGNGPWPRRTWKIAVYPDLRARWILNNSYPGPRDRGISFAHVLRVRKTPHQIEMSCTALAKTVLIAE